MANQSRQQIFVSMCLFHPFLRRTYACIYKMGKKKKKEKYKASWKTIFKNNAKWNV